MNGPFGVWQKIQSEQGSNAAVPPWAVRQTANASNHKGLPGVTTEFSRVCDEGGRWVATYDRRRVGVATDSIGKRTRTTPDIQPVNAARNL